jgi:hypothetical protein
VTGAVFLLTTCCGIHVGYSAILLPQLKAENSTLPTDEELGSWIGEISVPHNTQPSGFQILGLSTGLTARSTTNNLQFVHYWHVYHFNLQIFLGRDINSEY